MSKGSGKRPSGTPDNYVASGRIKSGKRPATGGSAFSGYGRSENVRGATHCAAKAASAASNASGGE